jgi:hypothetical protein
MAQEYADFFSQLEQARGLPPGFLYRMAHIESRFNPAARNGKHVGMFQFSPETGQRFGLSNPLDWRENARAAADYAASNREVLRNALGRDPQPWELYMAHQQGEGGASKLLSSPDTPAGQLTKPQFILANRGDPNAPARQFASLWQSKFDRAPAAPYAAGGTAYDSPREMNAMASAAAAQPTPAPQPGAPMQLASAAPATPAPAFAPPQQDNRLGAAGLNMMAAANQPDPYEQQTLAHLRQLAMQSSGQRRAAPFQPLKRFTGLLGQG